MSTQADRDLAHRLDAEDRRFELAAMNAAARERLRAAREAEQAAERARLAARRKAEGDAARAEVREQLRLVSPGITPAGLEAAVDQALADAARDALARQVAEKRRQIGL